MFVSNSMVRKVITINKDSSIFEAHEKMTANKIRHLPVVDAKNKLIGIVTDRDIRSAMPFSLLRGGANDEENAKKAEEKVKIAGLTVKDIMTPDPITISPMYTIQDALLMIQREKVGAFPVVDSDGTLTGILSVRDLLRAFVNVLGINEPGTLVGILVEEKIGQLKKIVDAITEEHISFGSVLVARHWEPNKRAVFTYLLTNNVMRVKKKLKALGYTLLDPMDWYLDQLPKSDSK
ncbi:MAG: CBS domain-containing protein [Desulfamplus sp.]|nr:CBS domain-containing protein [Desulfamplus sp.]MBF0411534.1 CBS domain-containing protein [Desulfamplus sp.]